MITHYDLFAGIGGFSLALDEVFYDEQIKHIFCEWEQFPTAVLKKHWPDGEYWGDIADLVANTKGVGRGEGIYKPEARRQARGRFKRDFTIVTGGFPCQPFSAAGRRRGTADDRYQWPNMLEVIRNTKPEWVIAENVRGLVTWNDGMVLETICSDLEAQGYEVQPFIIPAIAVDAPHRRDRVWIIGYAQHHGQHGTEDRQSHTTRNDRDTARQDEVEQFARPSAPRDNDAVAIANATGSGQQPGVGLERQPIQEAAEQCGKNLPDWSRDWQEVAAGTCNDTMDDGLPRNVGGLPYSRAKWRKEGLKAYGNAIVPQVAIQIMSAIRSTYAA